MIRNIIAPCLFFLLTSFSFGEITTEVVQTKVLTGLSSPEIVNGVILFNDASSTPKFSLAAKIKVVTEAKFIKVKARKTLFENGEIVKLDQYNYLLVGNGKYAVEITTFDPDKGIDETIVPVELGEPDPTPPGPDPTPPGPGPDPTPVPPDQFNDLGKRIANITNGLPLKKEVAKIYTDAAKELRENQSVTVNSVFDSVFKKRVDTLGASNMDKWKPFVDLLNSDLRSRWPMARILVAEYFDVIAVGLSVSQESEKCQCNAGGTPCKCSPNCDCGDK